MQVATQSKQSTLIVTNSHRQGMDTKIERSQHWKRDSATTNWQTGKTRQQKSMSALFSSRPRLAITNQPSLISQIKLYLSNRLFLSSSLAAAPNVLNPVILAIITMGTPTTLVQLLSKFYLLMRSRKPAKTVEANVECIRHCCSALSRANNLEKVKSLRVEHFQV